MLPFSFLYEKREAKTQIRKTASTSGVEGKEKRHIQTRCFIFFLTLNKTKTMNLSFFFNVTMAAAFVLMTF